MVLVGCQVVGSWWAVEGADCRKCLYCKGLGAVDLAIVDYLLGFCGARLAGVDAREVLEVQAD